jgi:DnaJ domain
VSDSSAARRAALTVLGLADSATAADVTQAYRRLAKLTHPDTAGRTDRDAARRFSALTDAYRSLTTPPSAGPQSSPVKAPSPAGRPVTVRVRPVRDEEPGQPPIVAGPVRITPLGRRWT